MPTKVPYKRGQVVQYSSPAREKWLPAKVTCVNSDGSLDLMVETKYPLATWSMAERATNVPGYMIRPRDRGPESPVQPQQDATLERTGTRSGTQYQVGQKIQYSCDKQQKWVPATVEAIPYPCARVEPSGVIHPARAGATLRLSSGTVLTDVPTYLMRHRSPDAIKREADQERSRAEAARRQEEADRRRLARDEAELRALESEIARKRLDVARRKREREQKEAAARAAAGVGGAADPCVSAMRRPGGEIQMTFKEPGPIGIVFGTVAKNAGETGVPTVVIQIEPGGSASRMKDCPITAGMKLTKVQGRSCEGLSFGATIERVRTRHRPLVLTFTHRERYGWVSTTDWGAAKDAMGQ